MNRRDFIKNLAMTGGGLALASYLPNVLAGAEQSYAQLFDSALSKNKSLLGWQGLTSDISTRRFQWQGKFPAALQGKTLFRNGPARQLLGGERYRHWFDGDGFINQFLMSDQGVAHTGKFVRTQKFNEESRAGKFLYNGAGSKIAHAKSPKSPDAVNTANTALLSVNHELWALWEAGSPYKIDPKSLETKGVVALSDGLAGAPFSAHPHRDSAGNIWNFGDASFLGENALLIYQLNPHGKLLKFNMIDCIPSYIHDFAVTDNYLIFYAPPISRQQADTFIESMSFDDTKAGQLIIVDKNTLAVHQRIEMESGFVFHFGNAWQEKHRLSINLCWYRNADVMLKTMSNIVGEMSDTQINKNASAQIHIDLVKGTATLVKSQIMFEFPQFDSRFVGQKSNLQFGVSVNNSVIHSQYDSIAIINNALDKVGHFHFGNSCVAEEPVFISAGSREGQGYLVNTTLDFAKGNTSINIFDAEDINQGPVALAELDQHLPLGFHGVIV